MSRRPARRAAPVSGPDAAREAASSDGAQVSRRVVLVHGAVSVVGVSTLGALLASCSGDDGPDATDPSSTDGSGSTSSDGAPRATIAAPVSDELGPNVRSLVTSPGAIAALGSSIVELSDAPTRSESLAMLEPLGLTNRDGVLDVDDAAAFRAAVLAAAQADAETDRRLVVGGWPLSRSSAALAVLFAAS